MQWLCEFVLLHTHFFNKALHCGFHLRSIDIQSSEKFLIKNICISSVLIFSLPPWSLFNNAITLKLTWSRNLSYVSCVTPYHLTSPSTSGCLYWNILSWLFFFFSFPLWVPTKVMYALAFDLHSFNYISILKFSLALQTWIAICPEDIPWENT